MPTADEPPHDFADQAIRDQLQNPANLRELLHEVLGEIADGFVCEEREILPRDFPLEDWRHRESDLLFRIPYKTPAETVPVFVCVLVEHQSRHDPLMPLRTLVYAVLYWERQWKAWETLPAPRPPLRLTPAQAPKAGRAARRTGGVSQVCPLLATAVPRPGRQDASGVA